MTTEDNTINKNSIGYKFWLRVYDDTLNVHSHEELLWLIYDILDEKKAFNFQHNANFNKKALTQILESK